MSLSLLVEKLADLRRGARFNSTDPVLIIGPLQFERVVNRLKAKFGSSNVEVVCPKELKDRWLQTLAEGRDVEFTQRELRTLSWYADVATSPQFIEYIEGRFVRIPKGVLRGILASYGAVWERANPNVELNRKLEAWVSQESNSVKLSWWADHPEYWLRPDAPQAISQRIRAGLMTVEVASREFRAPAASMLLVGAFSRAAEDMSQLVDLLTGDELSYLLKKLMQEKLLDLTSLHRAVCNLVKSRLANDSKAFREDLVNALLIHPRLGDPRIHGANWAEPTLEGARERLLSWLSAEDIRTFFEIILTRGNDPHGRKRFWLRYERQILLSRVFISTSDRKKRREQLEELSARGRNYGSIYQPTSAFVLDLGRIVAVEFSEVGNALYIYTKPNFNKIMPNMFVSRTDLSTLKREEMAVTRVIRRDGWTSKVISILEEYGIKTDS
jgi:hypothetical protein